MEPELLRAFRFKITLRRSSGEGPPAPDDQPPPGAELGNGAFQECTGLEIEMDVKELLEGGRNDGVTRQVGRAKYGDLVLKRGMLQSDAGVLDRELWRWLQGVVAGVRPVRRYDGIIEVQARDGSPVARWGFERGLPAKITGPQLNAQTGEIAIEELRIAHERLVLLEV